MILEIIIRHLWITLGIAGIKDIYIFIKKLVKAKAFTLSEIYSIYKVEIVSYKTSQTKEQELNIYITIVDGA